MSLLPILLLISAAFPRALQECVVPENQHSEVEQLEDHMLTHINYEVPSPSVLIALRLADVPFTEAEEKLLEALKEKARKDGQELSSGSLGLYVLALIASCETSSEIAAEVTADGRGLVSLLSDKLGEEIKSVAVDGHPLTTYHQVGLAMLGLCKQKVVIRKDDVQIFVEAAMNDSFKIGDKFSVDTAAIASLAFSCLQQRSAKPSGPIKSALIKLRKQIICAINPRGMIGDLYSTGLAMQALSTNHELVPPDEWNCSKSLQELLTEVRKGAFQNVGSASQILPSLVDKTYLDVDKVKCPLVKDNRTLPADGPLARCPAADDPEADRSLTAGSGAITVNITVNITVSFTVSKPCGHSIDVNVTEGSTLLRVVEFAQRDDPANFGFKCEESTMGPVINGICGTDSSIAMRTYWQFLNGTVPIPVGVSEYRPSNGEHIVANYTTY